MRRSLKILGVLMLTIGIVCNFSAFASESKGDPEKDGLIFGCIVLEDTKSFIDNMSFMRYPPKFNGFPAYPHDIEMYGIYTTGLFFADQVKPGQYWLLGFYTDKTGFQLKRQKTYCQLNYRPTEADTFTVNAGDIYYYGTYQYQVVDKGGFLSKGKFSLEKTDTPSEKELLTKVLEKLKGSKWEAKIQERLASL